MKNQLRERSLTSRSKMTEKGTNEVDALVNAFHQQTQLARGDVEAWLMSQNLQVLGALSTILIERPTLATKITPPLERGEYDEFLQRYIARCIQEDPQMDWVDTAHGAGHLLVRWLLGRLRRGDLDAERLAGWKTFLANLYLTGDETARSVVLNSVLEHLFQDSKMKKLFKDWRTHPELGEAYRLSN